MERTACSDEIEARRVTARPSPQRRNSMARTGNGFIKAAALLCTLVPALSHAQSPPYGKLVGSGTVTAASPRLTFTDGPFVMPNVTELASLLGLVGLGIGTPTCIDTPTLPGGALSTNQ